MTTLGPSGQPEYWTNEFVIHDFRMIDSTVWLISRPATSETMGVKASISPCASAADSESFSLAADGTKEMNFVLELLASVMRGD